MSLPVVLDLGSAMLRAGFAGSELPALIEPSISGMPKHQSVMLHAGASPKDVFLGANAMQNRGLLRLEHVVDRGSVTNWHNAELFVSYAMTKLGARRDEHPLLITEPVINPRRNREKMAELLFESFQAPACYFSLQPPLALYASGRTTGCVLDVGEGCAQAMPVYNGYMLPHATMRSDVAGADVTDSLILALRRTGLSLVSSAEREIARELKEAMCFITMNPTKDDLQSASGYRLPDGRLVEVTSQDRYRSAEVLFNPSLAGIEARGAHELLTDSIFKSDVDLRRDLLSSILITGGSTLTPGFAERLVSEIKAVTTRSARIGGGPWLPGDDLGVKIRVAAPPNRTELVWGGGSILASLSAFRSLWVARKRYEEVGASAVGTGMDRP